VGSAGSGLSAYIFDLYEQLSYNLYYREVLMEQVKTKSEYRKLLEEISRITGESVLWANIQVLQFFQLGLPDIATKEDAAREILEFAKEGAE
jgi:hypothetical protein